MIHNENYQNEKCKHQCERKIPHEHEPRNPAYERCRGYKCPGAELDDLFGQTLLSILSEDNVAYATNSRTFIESFATLCDMFADSGEEISAIKVIGGESKAGRHFITCAYAE